MCKVNSAGCMVDGSGRNVDHSDRETCVFAVDKTITLDVQIFDIGTGDTFTLILPSGTITVFSSDDGLDGLDIDEGTVVVWNANGNGDVGRGFKICPSSSSPAPSAAPSSVPSAVPSLVPSAAPSSCPERDFVACDDGTGDITYVGDSGSASTCNSGDLTTTTITSAYTIRQDATEDLREAFGMGNGCYTISITNDCNVDMAAYLTSWYLGELHYLGGVPLVAPGETAEFQVTIDASYSPILEVIAFAQDQCDCSFPFSITTPDGSCIDWDALTDDYYYV